MYCSPQPTVESAPDDAAPPVVCDDAGAHCACDITKWKQPIDCYTGPRGTAGKGVCVAGKRSCVDGISTECVGEVVPTAEVCDYVDNDCNGVIDDVAGTSALSPDAGGAVALDQCQSPSCDPDHSDASVACYTGTTRNVCRAGTKVCGPGRTLTCKAFAGITPQPEVCNGWDDDCNDQVDDGLDNLGSCDVDPDAGYTAADGGKLLGECLHGNSHCADGGEYCPPADPIPEKCNKKDDDCNGKVDDAPDTQLCGNSYESCQNGTCVFICPYVFAFDGAKFAYETSVGGASLVGKKMHLKQGKDVEFEPMWARLDHAAVDYGTGTGVVRSKLIAAEDEIVYFDAANLLAVEHAPGFEVFSSSSIQWNTLERKDPQEVFALRTTSMHAPLHATWMGRVDVTADLGRVDDQAAAYDLHEANSYDLDFGRVTDSSNARIVIDGWKYKEPRDLRADVAQERPHLDVRQKDGTWKKALEISTPRGDKKAVVFSLAGLAFPTGRYELRLVTGTHEDGNAMWYLDRVRLTEEAPGAITQTVVPASTANLDFMGAPTEPSFGNHAIPRQAIDDGKGELLPEQHTWGAFTRYGDVRSLLGASDDRMVVMRRGDGVELQFVGVPRASAGRELTVFMMSDLLFKPRKWLTAKDASALTENVTPLPYHGMGHYPPDRPFPSDEAHQAWQKQYQTRVYTKGDPRWGR